MEILTFAFSHDGVVLQYERWTYTEEYETPLAITLGISIAGSRVCVQERTRKRASREKRLLWTDTVDPLLRPGRSRM